MTGDKSEVENQLVEIEKEIECLDAQRRLLLHILETINSEVPTGA